MEQAQREEEEAAREVEARVRRQVEERARRQGAESARREAAESVMAAEERARVATLAAEEKAIRLQAELDALQRRLEEAQRAAARSGAPTGEAEGGDGGDGGQRRGGGGGGGVGAYADDEDEEEDEGGRAVEQAVRAVEAATREEIESIEWARRAVSASGDFPEVPATAVLSATEVDHSYGGGGGGGEGREGAPLSELIRWVCIRVPRGRISSRRSVLMDTPYGRFAVLIPAGLPPGAPLLVPVPASGAPAQIGSSNAPPRTREGDDTIEQARNAQLSELVRLGFSAAEAAHYCDGVTPVEQLAELIRSDSAALEHTEAAENDMDAGEADEAAIGDEDVGRVQDEAMGARVGTPRGGGGAAGGGGASSFCVVS
jgi:hypothetical protein